MEFGNGALLGAMALGAIPIIIHLINRQRAKLVRFAAIEFLMMSDKRLARRLKLKQWLVLALRVLLLAGLAFAVAKPYVSPDSLEAPSASDPGAIAIVIDDSWSMEASSGEAGVSVFDKAVESAKVMVASGGPRTSFAILASGAPARVLSDGLSYDREALLRALDRLTPAARSADLPGALKEAGRLLSQSPEPRRQAVIFSDQAAHQWGELGFDWGYVPLTSLKVVDTGGDKGNDDDRRAVGRGNVAIVGVEVAPGSGAGPMEIVVTVANYGPVVAAATVELDLGGGLSADKVSVPAGEKAEVIFSLKPKGGSGKGVARLRTTGEDRLAEDNKWYFTVDQTHALNVLLVNGAPRSVAYLDELFFVRAAFLQQATGEVGIHPVYVTAEELTPGRIKAVDVVILANVGILSPEQQLSLSNFVEAGGGLVIAAGDGLTDKSALTYRGLLPLPIRGVKKVAEAGDRAAVLSALQLATVDFSHPIFDVFDGVDDASLFKAHTYGYALVDTAERSGEGHSATVIASFTGGIPAIIEGRIGRGKVLMLTTSVDMDWSDLAIRSSFVPLVQRMVQYLGGALDHKGGLGHMAGEPIIVDVPDGNGPLLLTRPDGAVVRYEESPDDALSGTLFVESTELPGHYDLARAGDGDGRRSVHFAINGDRRESDLRRAPRDVIASVTDAVTRDNGVLPEESPKAMMAAGTSSRGRTILWPYVLAGLMFLFGAEAWLVVRG